MLKLLASSASLYYFMSQPCHQESQYAAPYSQSDIKLFVGSHCRTLGTEVATHLGWGLGRMNIGMYPDGESKIRLYEPVKGKDVWLIGSVQKPINNSLIELLFTCSTMKNSGAKTINIIIPYLGYSRDFNHSSSIASMLEAMGVDSVFTVDYHHDQIHGFFQKPVQTIPALSLPVSYLTRKNLVRPIIVSPDVGGQLRALEFKDALEAKGVTCEMATLVKIGQRKLAKRGHGQRKDFYMLGGMDWSNRDVIIVDDIIDTGTTLFNVVDQLKQAKSKRIFAVASHGVFSDNFRDRVEHSGLEECIVTNTIVTEDHNEKIVELSIAKLLADTINRVHNGKPLKI